MIKYDPLKQANWSISDERTFYRPHFFDKHPNPDSKRPTYVAKLKQIESHDESPQLLYWASRDSGKWKVPRVFEQSEPFY